MTAIESAKKSVFVIYKVKTIAWLLIVSMLAAGLYGYLRLYFSGEHLLLIKMTSILCLALIVHFVKTKDTFFNNLLITALLLHCLGDGAIEQFSNIIFAIPFFLLGHILYSVIFIRDILYDGLYNLHNSFKAVWWQYGLILLIAILAVQIAVLFLPRVSGALYYAVIVYITILSITTIVSVLHPACLKWVGFGIGLYVVSDFLIAYNAFVNPIGFKQFLSWPLYYFAQFSIVYGLLKYHLNLKSLSFLEVNP